MATNAPAVPTISTEDLFKIIGAQQYDVIVLRSQLNVVAEQLKEALQENVKLKSEIAELQTPAPSQPPAPPAA